MKMPVAPQRYIIQIDLAPERVNSARATVGTPVDLKQLQRLLQGTGIELDKNYRPICVNAQQQRVVVRGQATPEARQRAEKMLGDGVKFFSDGRVQMASAQKFR